MLKRCLFAVLFGLIVFAAGLDAGGVKDARADWQGANTTCPDDPGVSGLAGICPSLADACRSWEDFYGWPWIKTEPNYSSTGYLLGFWCVLLRNSPIGPIDHAIVSKPLCSSGVTDPLGATGCAAYGTYFVALGPMGCGGDRKSGKRDTSSPGNPAIGNPMSLVAYNKYEEATDFMSEGPEPFGFTRYYNSRARYAWRSSHGQVWRTNFDRRMRFYPS
jgi:hypothetical protein